MAYNPDWPYSQVRGGMGVNIALASTYATRRGRRRFFCTTFMQGGVIMHKPHGAPANGLPVQQIGGE